VDAETRQIVASALTGREVDDGGQADPLLDQVSGSVASFTADGAYDQEGVAATVAEAILQRRSSCRRGPRLCQARRPRPRPRAIQF